MLSTEIQLLELRIEETKEFVDTIILIEVRTCISADLIFWALFRRIRCLTERPRRISQYTTRKEYYEDSPPIRRLSTGKFEYSIDVITALIWPRQVQLEATPGSPWNNEALMRNTLTRIIHEQTTNVHLGDLIIMSDIDEIPSRAALTLARTCEIPPWLHLSMKNYMYSFEFPLHDHGYWRASIVTATSDVVYSHQRHSDDLLLGAGWHCSWCFATIEEFVSKMQVNDQKSVMKLFADVPVGLLA